MHTWLEAHVLQSTPPVPHAVTAVPVWHFPALSQQPVAHEVALHTPLSVAPWPVGPQCVVAKAMNDASPKVSALRFIEAFH